MRTKGLFYIQHNQGAVLCPMEFWNRTTQCWTTEPHLATFFGTRAGAEAEAWHAERRAVGEAVVLQATRDLTDDPLAGRSIGK